MQLQVSAASRYCPQPEMGAAGRWHWEGDTL